MRVCLGVVLLLAANAVTFAQAPWSGPFTTDRSKAYPCVRAEGPVVIDGALQEPAWQRATVIEGFIVPPRMDPVAGAMTKAVPALSQTHARLMWDDEHLYLGAELDDQDIYCVTPDRHDAGFSTDDIVELFLKPSDALPYYWEFHVVPSGGTRDYFYARRNAGGDSRWKVYESGMQARVSLRGSLNHWADRDTGWVAEVRIPWAAFAQMGGKPRPGAMWRFLVSRYDYSVHLPDGCELSAAAALPIQSYHLYEYYPYLRFVP